MVLAPINHTNFPDKIKLVKCNIKIRKGGYADYAANFYNSILYYKSDGSQGSVFVKLYFKYENDKYNIISTNYTVY